MDLAMKYKFGGAHMTGSCCRQPGELLENHNLDRNRTKG